MSESNDGNGDRPSTGPSPSPGPSARQTFDIATASYISSVATGEAHYPHDFETSCVRCERDELLDQVRDLQEEKALAYEMGFEEGQRQARAETAVGVGAEKDGLADQLRRDYEALLEAGDEEYRLAGLGDDDGNTDGNTDGSEGEEDEGL